MPRAEEANAATPRRQRRSCLVLSVLLLATLAPIPSAAAADPDDFVEKVSGAARDDPTTTQGSTGTRLQVGPSPVNGAAALGLGLLWDADGTDSYSREGRGDDRADGKGVFVDGRCLAVPPAP